MAVIIPMIELPAPIFLGIWIALQFFTGLASIHPTAEAGGVAWMAHVGGFAFGAAWAYLMPKARDDHTWVDRYRPKFYYVRRGD